MGNQESLLGAVACRAMAYALAVSEVNASIGRTMCFEEVEELSRECC